MTLNRSSSLTPPRICRNINLWCQSQLSPKLSKHYRSSPPPSLKRSSIFRFPASDWSDATIPSQYLDVDDTEVRTTPLSMTCDSDMQTECSLESSLIMRLSNSILDIINSASHHVSLEPTPWTLSHLCHHYLALIVTKFLRDHREHNLDEKCFVIGKAILFSFT